MAKRPIRVFVASPGDVQEERDALSKLIAQVNQTSSVIAPEKEISLEVVRWETNAYPSAGRPQAVINEQIGEYDIFVGIMWTRFGTSTGMAESGTEEEFNLAYESWTKNGRPEIMFYFCQAPAMPVSSREQLKQQQLILDFREKLEGKALYWFYQRHDEFANTVFSHLLNVLKRVMASGEPERMKEIVQPPQSDLDFVDSQLRELADEYHRTRESMAPGDTRTRQMEIIVTKMRTIALSAVPLLPALTHSEFPGERLAAIAVLQVTPQAEYIEWLGEACMEKQPFIGYHAGVALLTSVRMLDCMYKARLETAIQRGMDHLSNQKGTDRFRTLEFALKELWLHCP